MVTVEYDEIENIIKSAISRVTHDTPSTKTLELIANNKGNIDSLGGKIDKLTKLVEEHNTRHEADMEDLRPIIIEYNERQIRDKFLKNAGEGAKWIAGVLTAIGVLWLFVKGIFRP